MEENKPIKVVFIPETTSDQLVTPIHDGVAQPQCTFEEYVRNLSKSNPNTWSKI